MPKNNQQATSESKTKKSVVTSIIGTGKSKKDKRISATISSATYAQFQQINDALGMSNNSVINKLITEYVRENKEYLEEE